MKTTWGLINSTRSSSANLNNHLNEDIYKKIVAQSEGHIEFFTVQNSGDFVKFFMRMTKIVNIEKKASLQFDKYISKVNYSLGNTSN